MIYHVRCFPNLPSIVTESTKPSYVSCCVVLKNWPHPTEMLRGPPHNACISNIFLLEVMHELGSDTESDCLIELKVLLLFIA